jgi:hypothetical protein
VFSLTQPTLIFSACLIFVITIFGKTLLKTRSFSCITQVKGGFFLTYKPSLFFFQQCKWKHWYFSSLFHIKIIKVRVMVFNNIYIVISWQSVLLVVSHNVVLSAPCLSGIRPHNFIADFKFQ